MQNFSLADLSAAGRARLLQQAKAAKLKTSSASQVGITRVERSDALPLSFAQQRLWFLAQFGGVSEAYHIASGVQLDGQLDRLALHKALDAIVARHEVLRTTFTMQDGAPVQRIADGSASKFVLLEQDLSAHPQQESELQRLLLLEATAAFDLQNGPLLRGRLIKMAADRHSLLLTMHHIISDGWSMAVFIDELCALYGAFGKGQVYPLPPLSIQYVDYAVWQRQWLAGEQLQRQAEYWQAALANAPALLELPTDMPRPAEQNFAGAIAEITLDAELAQGLNSLSKQYGMTMYMLMLAAWAVLMGRLSGQNDIVIGSPIANRHRLEIEPLIGFFVNTLALRIKVDAKASVSDFLNAVKERVLAAQSHQDLPFEQVVELVQPNRSLAHAPLFQVMLAWQNTPKGWLDFPGLSLQPLKLPHVSAQVDLSLIVDENDDGSISGELEYATELFRPETVRRYLTYWRNLLRGMLKDPQQPLAALPMLPAHERQQIIHTWNATDAAYPQQASVASLFAAQAALRPEAIAVEQGSQHWTYAQLDQQANHLAQRLRSLGLGREQVAAILLERSFELIVAQLAVLKCAAAYLPLDAGAPEERQAFMLKDSAARLLITRSDRPLPGDTELLRLDVDLALSAIEPSDTAEHLPGLDADGNSTAYIMYTSGSTGQPKGVRIAQRGISRLVINNHYLPLDADSRLAFAANPAFDASTLEVWGALLNGGRSVVIDKEAFLAPQRFAQVLNDHQISVLFITSALFNQYANVIPDVLAQIPYLLTGGERADPSAFAKVLQAGDGSSQLIHCYGPTETTTFAITHAVRDVAADASSIPLGKPIANTCIYILDQHLQAVPTGVNGEIYIGGPGVALGYLHRPALSAERFLPDPYAGQSEALMYKTGDLAYWRADGLIEFVGRNDFQVKIRGFRIELGEIEACLCAHPAVNEALVSVLEDQPGEKRLVAYYSATDNCSTEDLRNWLAASLPDYMLPAAYVKLAALPLNANGKVDRKALPNVGDIAYAQRDYAAPEGEVESQLAGLWAQLLKIERIGRHDNFFELGGHSLLAVQLMLRIQQEFAVELDLQDVFLSPVLQQLAERIVDRQLSEFDADELAELAVLLNESGSN